MVLDSISGKEGGRIEDDMGVTADGGLSFSNFERELRVVGA